MTETYTVREEDTIARADRLLSEKFEKMSRSYLRKLFDEGLVTVSGKAIRPSEKLRTGDVISMDVPEPEAANILPEDIPLDIIYEDDQILVVNKPKGMVVHPSAGHTSGTLVNALINHCGSSLSGINGVARPGIVHRIDKDTTGSLIVCKTDWAHKSLSEQLKAHSITRKYRAIVHGKFDKSAFTLTGEIARNPRDRKKMAIVKSGGREAVTDVSVIGELNGFTYIECTLHTGRTHQIRVQLSSINHPVLGDPLYGPKKCPVKGLEGQTLHAYLIGFEHPLTREYMEFTAPLPDYFTKLLQKLNE